MDLCATYNDACKIALGKTGLLNISIILAEVAICKTFDKLDFLYDFVNQIFFTQKASNWAVEWILVVQQNDYFGLIYIVPII